MEPNNGSNVTTSVFNGRDVKDVKLDDPDSPEDLSLFMVLRNVLGVTGEAP